MQELNKKDYARIKKVNQTYHKLGITWVPGIEEKLGQAYGKAFQAFVERCQNNEEWRNAYLFMQNYKDVVNFDMDSHFEITLGDSEYKLKVFKASIKNEYIDSHENLDKYRRQTNEKINALNQKRFALCRKFRIEQLKQKFQNIENEANLYAYWQKKDELKNDYLQNQTEKYHVVHAKFEQIEANTARTVAIEALKHKSVLTYRDIDTVLTSNFEVDGNTYTINSRALNAALSELRHEIMDEKATTTENELSRN